MFDVLDPHTRKDPVARGLYHQQPKSEHHINHDANSCNCKLGKYEAYGQYCVPPVNVFIVEVESVSWRIKKAFRVPCPFPCLEEACGCE